MTLLPIAQRELRVASRQSVTYWTRVGAAALITAVAGMGLMVTNRIGSAAGLSVGTILFQSLSWLTFVVAAAAGVFLTSDCLSEEKRDGTLGLLFLTDLRGYDVVLGKLLATSLRAAYGLLGMMPILALPLLLGGVTGAQFWRATLALANTLFFSLALGMCVSAVSRDNLRAMTAALTGAFGFFLLPHVADVSLHEWYPNLIPPLIGLISPSLAMKEASSATSQFFWLNLGITHGLAWGFIGLASVCVPRAWQQKTSARRKDASALQQALRKVETAVGRTRSDAALLEKNPVLWLASLDRWMAWMMRGVVIVVPLVILPSIWWSLTNRQVGFVLPWATSLITVPFGFWVAMQSGRFFCEGRRSGMLELMLATPLRAEEIVQGHWRAMLRAFLLPTMMLVVLMIAGAWAQVLAYRDVFVQANQAGSMAFVWQQAISQGFGTLTFLTDLGALAWFGAWMGLTSKKTSAAFLKTILFVQFLPWLAMIFVQMFLMMPMAFTGANGQVWIYVSAVAQGLLSLGINIAFIAVSRRKMLDGFREMVSGVGAPRASQLKPPLIPAPPVLSNPPPTPAE